MKKLMKAVTAAAVALVASGAFATLPSPKQDFTDLEVGKKTVNNIVANADDKYWFAVTNASQELNGEIGSIANETGRGNFLTIEAQAPLYRTVNEVSGNGYGDELSGAEAEAIPAIGIYLDTMVKFTVSSDAFKDGDLDAADKLAITCYSPDEGGPTNLLVRAGYVGSSVVATNYVMELPANFDVDGWHQLTVRAIADVGSSTAPVGFAVYLDRVLLTYGTDVAAGNDTYVNALNAAVKQNLYNGTTHALLPSLVTTGDYKNTLTAVGFKGTGSLDDIQFTNVKPDFINEGIAVSITWDANVASYKVMAGEDTLVETTTSGAGSTNLTLDAGVNALTVTATYANGYERGTWTVTGDGAQISGSTFTVANGAKLDIVSMVPMFDVGGTHYGTFADALENATGAEGSPATIKLMADYTGDIQFDQNTVNYIVLDLAGKTLTGGEDAAIHTGVAVLTITNSTETIGHVVAPEGGLAVVCDGESLLTVTAGIFDGEIADDSGDTATIVINAGTFYDPYYAGDQTLDFYLKSKVPEGTSISDPSNYYFTVGGAQPVIGTFKVTVTTTANATYTVTGEASKDGDVVTVATGHTITITATPAWNYEYATTPTGWTAGENYAITMDVSAAGTVEIPAPTALAGWGFYLGRPVDGAYTIDNVADLNKLREGVAAGVATANVTFKQTADIDMQNEVAFAGIGTYAKVPTAGTPFLGTYDGQGYKISNVKRAGEHTQGIFNQVGPSGVIENLVVSNMYWDTELSGEYGFAIVGNAGGGATLRNLTAEGTFGSASKPSTHNMAGIVVRLSPGATAGEATTIDSCTNNATIYGGYTKLGGINAIVQDQTGFKNGKVVFVNCANNGTLVCKRTAADVTGNAGIVGYFSGTNVELTGCYGNGEITNADGANTDKDGALVGWTYGGTIKDNGGNAAPAGKKMIGTWGSATETGFLYATVADGVATTISGSIAASGSYLLEGAATPAITLAENESITFDTALGYTLTESSIAAASGLELKTSESGTAKTFTAKAPVTPIEPGQSSKSYATEADAQAAAAAVEVGVPTAVATALSTEAQATYKAMFEPTVVSDGAGGYKVEVAMTAAAAEATQSQADADAAEVIEDLTEANVTLTTTPGLYYSFEYGTSLENMTEGTRTLATGSTLELARPTTENATSGFYKVLVNITDK